jgi:hypothetical protein
MCVAPLTIASLFCCGWRPLNSITYPRAPLAEPAALHQIVGGAEVTEPGLIDSAASAYSQDEEVRHHLFQLPRRLPPP